MKEEIKGRAAALLQAALLVAAFVVFGKASESVVRGNRLNAAETGTVQPDALMDSIMSSAVAEYKAQGFAGLTASDSTRILAEAFAVVESTQNPKAYNRSSGATGYLQLKPIMVDEANRLQNIERHTVGVQYYSLDDRWDKDKSVEMFSVVMRNRNFGLSVRRACRLWNYKHSELYYQTVKQNFERLLEEAVQ